MNKLQDALPSANNSGVVLVLGQASPVRGTALARYSVNAIHLFSIQIHRFTGSL
jgi:hypothetical protein